jgi:hypothetical protein
MPVPQLQSYAKGYNIPLPTVEKFWKFAKKQYGEDWEAVSGTVKRMCKNYKKYKLENKTMTNIDKALEQLTEGCGCGGKCDKKKCKCKDKEKTCKCGEPITESKCKSCKRINDMGAEIDAAEYKKGGR